MNNFLISKPFDFKNNSFDFIRLLMSVLVVAGHSGGVGGFGWEPHLDMRDWEPGFTNMATFSVYGFFVISGFLITRSWLGSKSLQDFCVKRIKRIYPGYLVSLLISGLIFVPIFFLLKEGFHPIKFLKEYSRETFQYIIQNLFVEVRKPRILELTKFNESNFDINGPHWSLIHEMRAYGLVVILGLIGWLKRQNLALLIAIVFNLTYIVCSLNYFIDIGSTSLHFRDLISTYLGDYHWFIIFTYFIFGMAFYIFFEKIVWNNWIYLLSILGLIIGWRLDIFPVFGPLCFTYFVLYSSQVFPFRNLSKKIGDLSYGIYIYSWPIQLCLLYLGANKLTNDNTLNYPIYMTVSIICSALAGFLSWNFVEKKWLVKKI
jgi:peptidoglycan/LPS O-acetylase OafA/YrhL